MPDDKLQDTPKRPTKRGIYSKDAPPPYDRVKLYPEYHRFVDWYSTLSILRNPKSQDELAKEMGLHATTLSKWKLMPEFEKDVYDAMKPKLKFESVDVLNAWVHRLKRNSAPGDIKLVLQWLHDYEESTKSKVESDELKDIASALKAIANRD